MSSPLDNCVVVLNEPQDLVNIAGTVRAMMNMGLARLRLVRPAEFDAYRIAGIAHGAQAVLERTELFDSLRAALADAAHIAGATARRRTAPYVWQHPREAAPELLELAAAAGGPVTLLFGREDTGLSNEELDLCDRLLVIPTNPRHRSLNLAQAVLIVAYELWLAGPGTDRPLPAPRRGVRPATAEQLQLLFQEAEAGLEAIDFFKARNAPALLRTLRALARRARPNEREARLLRAMALELQKFLARKG
ncbi:MAG: tRNA (cytosine(32)/uridine(32)-2'-O)-methyltransferase TrmJ [Gemmatimonadetes bacterium]|nr:tRNA (cytosine(32)/uridine(32)-2'-O)-methyltransferase TrmJ [Gemmatimonadota bacterium]